MPEDQEEMEKLQEEGEEEPRCYRSSRCREGPGLARTATVPLPAHQQVWAGGLCSEVWELTPLLVGAPSPHRSPRCQEAEELSSGTSRVSLSPLPLLSPLLPHPVKSSWPTSSRRGRKLPPPTPLFPNLLEELVW